MGTITRLLSSALLALVSFSFGLVPAAFAAAAPSTNPADAAPGQLRLPLIVQERSGVARHGAVVTSGVPFPPGFLKDVKQLRVVDAAGKPVPAQAHLMLPWRPPTYDNSVQWALVSFVADVEANATATYTLTDAGGPETAAASPIALNQEGENITISTGNASFVIPKSGTALIASAKLGDKAILGGEGLRAVITTGDWPDKKLKLGDKQIAAHDKVTVEEAGPLRTVIAIEGMYTPGDVNKKMYDFTTRLYFEANTPSVRVFHTIGNGYLDPTLVDGLRRIPIWPIKDASLVADLAIDGASEVRTLVDGKQISAKASADPLIVYQDSSGGDNWRDLKGTVYDKWLAQSTQGKTVPGVTFRGFKATQGAQELAAGNQADGAIEVGTPNSGLSAAVRSFAVQHPIAIGASAKQLSVELLSGRFSQLFHLDSGQRKSWDVRLWLNGDAKTSLADRHNEQETLLLFRVDPRWMLVAGECGAWPEGFALLPTPKTKTGEPAPVPGRMDKSKFDGTNSGWDWYGWISGFNSGGGHWNQTPTLNDWLLRGNGAEFDVSESRSLWAADLGAIHFKQIDLSVFWYWIKGGSGNVKENRIQIETFPDYQKRDVWGLWDSGHMGMLPWTEYYLLTGDAHVREALEHMGVRARAYLWSSNHDDKNDGTGPMARAIDWCKKRDADKDPTFRLATRYVGWPLYGLAHYYRLTGDPELLAEAQNIAKSFRNTARYSPIGFMVLQINKAGDGSVYGHQGPFAPFFDQSASQCYAHFQQALMCQGLVEYYLMSKDIEALDPLIAFSDLLTHRAMLHDENGKRVGWTYAFGDYWGPYTLEQAKKSVTFISSNAPCLQIIGWVAHFTGRKDFREAIAEPSSGELPSNSQAMAADMVTLHPRADLQPPAAIKDLKAEALGGGKVKLTWSTPAGDPAWYQLKWSTAKIMERIEGWPDRTEPLPQDQPEWEAKAAAFNAKQVNFWAANNAAGVPLQSAAGATQSVTLENLPPGKVNFAIKAWDAASNMSDISNVIEIEVK